ncbi:MAG: signal peptidase II [Gammaproteobacteria bacterium]|nr:signal peptidase II [Gammaproteobacteria bacterium]
MALTQWIKNNFKPLPFKQSGFVWLWLTPLVFAIDYWTKQWADKELAPAYFGPAIEVMPYFNLKLAYNEGAAFSSFEGMTFMLIALPVVIVIGMVLWMWQTPKARVLINTGIALILGGAFGNLYDRIFNDGKVIDFIDWYIVWDGVEKHWPTFNIADSVILIGVGLLIIDAIKNPEHKKEQNKG